MAINAVGVSGWSPVAYLQPASVPSTPPAPEYSSSNATAIVLNLFGSDNDGGSAITNYELWIDGGSLTSSFTKVATYSYSTDGFSATVSTSANSLTTGTIYRFIFRSQNAIGYS